VVATNRGMLDLSESAAIAVRFDDLTPALIVKPAAYTAVGRAKDERDVAWRPIREATVHALFGGPSNRGRDATRPVTLARSPLGAKSRRSGYWADPIDAWAQLARSRETAAAPRPPIPSTSRRRPPLGCLGAVTTAPPRG